MVVVVVISARLKFMGKRIRGSRAVRDKEQFSIIHAYNPVRITVVSESPFTYESPRMVGRADDTTTGRFSKRYIRKLYR